MSLIELEQHLHGLKQRAARALDKLEANLQASVKAGFDKAGLVASLIKAHEQAEQAVKDGPNAVKGAVAWELAHGLSVLGLLGDKKPLPKTAEEFPTVAMKDGTLLGCRPWELLDPRWAEALVQWLEHLHWQATFGTTPVNLKIENNAVLAIAGDWGTGTEPASSPAAKTAKAMRAIHAHYTIHLGDVYYAGTAEEERNNMRGWPQGSRGSFNLNSNHEMYNGSIGYFAELRRNFPLQNNTSYFALHNDYWLIVGLDTAFYSKSDNLYMDGVLEQGQLDWLATLPKNLKVIVLSHHEGYTPLADKKTPLYEQVAKALGRVPNYWYWGHLHNGIVYQPSDGLHGRCIGHGAIPYANARELAGDPRIAWYETQLADDPGYPLRVLNGFAKVTLNGNTLAEQLMDENGQVRWSA